MGRPIKTRAQYFKEYAGAIRQIASSIPLRKVAKDQKIGLSTCMRLKKKFF